MIFVALGGAGLRLAWVRAATPADLDRYVSGAHDPSGRWLYAEGLSRRGGGTAFLIDTEETRYVPLGLDPLWGGHLLGIAFADDGSPGTTTHFLVDHDGTVVRRDFATGEERVVAGPGTTPGERLENPALVP